MLSTVGPCPKCGGAMEEGAILYYTYGAVLAASWIRGPLQKSFWRGVKAPRKDTLNVRAYRCAQCAYLEVYAPPT